MKHTSNKFTKSSQIAIYCLLVFLGMKPTLFSQSNQNTFSIDTKYLLKNHEKMDAINTTKNKNDEQLTNNRVQRKIMYRFTLPDKRAIQLVQQLKEFEEVILSDSYLYVKNSKGRTLDSILVDKNINWEDFNYKMTSKIEYNGTDLTIRMADREEVWEIGTGKGFRSKEHKYLFKLNTQGVFSFQKDSITKNIISMDGGAHERFYSDSDFFEGRIADTVTLQDNKTLVVFIEAKVGDNEIYLFQKDIHGVLNYIDQERVTKLSNKYKMQKIESYKDGIKIPVKNNTTNKVVVLFFKFINPKSNFYTSFLLEKIEAYEHNKTYNVGFDKQKRYTIDRVNEIVTKIKIP